jgi:wobble nucleotide-excising tRNase
MLVITKITKLFGVGTLHAPLPNGALSLKAKTIVYGENGRGKTTFVALLRSLACGDTSILDQRRTIKGTHPQSAQILINNHPHDLANGVWTKTHSDICVFDTCFISENVYSGTSVDPDHRKNLLSFAIGATGVALANKVDQLAADISGKRTAEGLAKEKVRTFVKGSITPEQFASLMPAEEGAEKALEEARRLRDALSRASTLQGLQTLTPISFEGVSQEELAAVLVKTLDTVSAEADALIRDHISTSHATEHWLAEGTTFDSGDACPYCARETEGLALIDAYKAIFSEAYKSYKSGLKTSLELMETNVSAERIATVKATIEGNRSKLLPWKEFIPEADIDFALEPALESIRDAKSTLRVLKEKKLASPLELLAWTEAEGATLDGLRSTLTAIDDYNAVQVQINDSIAALRGTVAKGNLVEAEAAVCNLENRMAKGSIGAQAASKALVDSIAERQKLEAEKATARTQLDTYTATVVGKYKDSINNHLKGCGTSFQITELKTVYTGAKPRFDYALELFGTPVDLASKPGSPIKFDSALSQGDKSALAFAFFLARLENDPKCAEQIVVFDDPLSSLDSCRRRYTRTEIASLAPKVAQLIVLTHEESTVADIAVRLNEVECSLIILKPHGDFSTFSITSVKEITASDYVRCFDTLNHYTYGTGDPSDVVKSIRPFLEMNLRYRFPEEFGPSSLGQMIGQIKTADSSKPLAMMNVLRPQLEDINDFCTKHSHGDAALTNAEKMLESDLKSVVLKALNFARGFPASTA